MAEIGISADRCILSHCSSSASLKTFKLQAVKRLIECAVERGDDEIHDKLQTMSNSQGEQINSSSLLFLYLKRACQEMCDEEKGQVSQQ